VRWEEAVTGLDPTVAAALLTAGAAVVGGGLTLLGLYITRGTETRKLLTDVPQGYALLVNELQEERIGLRVEMARLVERDTHRETELGSMRARLRGLEAGQDADRKLISARRSAAPGSCRRRRRTGPGWTTRVGTRPRSR
jgi:hypothetical protein